MRCYFDVLTRVHVDTKGVEVADFSCAMDEAKRALAEMLLDDDSGIRFKTGTYLLVRADSENLMGVLPLDELLEPSNDVS